MVNILLISHSKNIAKSVYEFANEMKQGNFVFDYIGGIEEVKVFGTNPMEIADKIRELTKNSELLIIYDLGSSLLNSQMAMQMINDENIQRKVAFVDCAFLEGTIIAVSSNVETTTANELKEFVESQCKITK